MGRTRRSRRRGGGGDGRIDGDRGGGLTGPARPHAQPSCSPRWPATRGTPPPMSGTVVESAALGIPQLPGEREPVVGAVDADRVAHDQALVRRPGPPPARTARAAGRNRRDPQRPHGVGLAEQLGLGAADHRAGAPGRAACRPPAAGGPRRSRRRSPRSRPHSGAHGRRAHHQRHVGADHDGGRAGRLPAGGRAQGQPFPGRPGGRRDGRAASRRRAWRSSSSPGARASPAFQTGFTSITFAAPPASTFAFTPPKGRACTR